MFQPEIICLPTKWSNRFAVLSLDLWPKRLFSRKKKQKKKTFTAKTTALSWRPLPLYIRINVLIYKHEAIFAHHPICTATHTNCPPAHRTYRVHSENSFMEATKRLRVAQFFFRSNHLICWKKFTFDKQFSQICLRQYVWQPVHSLAQRVRV